MRDHKGYVTYEQNSGLANRLRLHFLAYAYAKKTNRKLVTNWKRNEFCHAIYSDLFIGGPPEFNSLPFLEKQFLKIASFISKKNFRKGILPEFNMGIESLPDSSAKVVHFEYNVEASTYAGSRLGPYHDEVLSTLIPKNEILEDVNQFLNEIENPRIGIHIRLGDFIDKFGNSLPTMREYVNAIKTIHNAIPGALFILVSNGNDEELGPILETGLVITRKKVNQRDNLDGIKDALTDMLILSKTDFIIATPKSSFSRMGAFLGGIPIIQIEDRWEAKLKESNFTINIL